MKKIKKIIQLIDWPFCQRDYERLGIKLLQQNGFEVEVWNFAPFLHSDIYKSIKVPDPVNYLGYKVFLDINGARSAISGLEDNCFIISFLLFKLNTWKLYKFITQKDLSYCVYTAGSSYPLGARKSPKEDNLGASHYGEHKKLNWLKNINLTHVTQFIFYHMPLRLLGVKPADLVLAGAERTSFQSIPMNNNTEVLWIHYLDYDIYLQEINKLKGVDKKIGVFLDEYLPFHPDWLFCKIANPLTPEEYFPYLCNFFDYLENNLNVEINIAAHPRSHYESGKDYFGGRRVIRGQTAELVRNSEFVLAHASFSINFAVLFKKPVIFMTLDNLNHHLQQTEIEIMAETLGKSAINLNKPYLFDWNKELRIDENKYEQYKHYYIKKKGTEESPFWQIVADRLKRFHQANRMTFPRGVINNNIPSAAITGPREAVAQV